MGTAESPASKKRKRVATPTKANTNSSKKVSFVDLTGDDEAHGSSPNAKMKKTSPAKTKSEEKRLRKFRAAAPASYREKLSRATTQRLFVVDRSRSEVNGVLEETIEMAGTTGNIYNVKIGLLPSCSCPDNQKGNQCKHIVYALHKVLKAPDHLQYQLALLSSELREIFGSAPLSFNDQSSTDGEKSNRKEISGDCPICFTEFDPTNEELVYCRAACGNNIHKECFEQWAKTKAGSEVRCVYCRTPWEGDEESLRRICKNKGKINGEGYVNVAEELGLSGGRDYSTYHQPWVRREGFGYY